MIGRARLDELMVTVRQTETAWNLEPMLPVQRARLVRLCASLSGDVDAAEDLAQETLIEAWRHADRLYDPAGADRWLSAIARNVCLRWRRWQGRQRVALAAPVETVPDRDADVAIELERDELAVLLDRALALLPAETRAALVARYIEESPEAEIAARLGVSAGAVAVRLHRGKLTLRRLLQTDLRDDAVAFGLVPNDADTFVETRLWCTHCGQRRLLGRFGAGAGESALQLRCPHCDLWTDVNYADANFSAAAAVIDGIKTFKPALVRLCVWTNNTYRRWLPERRMPCPNCGRWMPLHLRYPADAPPVVRGIRGIYGKCLSCGFIAAQTFGSFVLCLPEGQQFWRAHPRINTLPVADIEAAGIPVLVTTYASMTDGARFTVISARDTYDVIRVDGAARR